MIKRDPSQVEILVPRLAGAALHDLAAPVDPDEVDPQDARLIEFSNRYRLLEILAHGVPRVLLQWPDRSIGLLWLHADVPLGEAVQSAYDRARSCLEAIHLRESRVIGHA